MFFYQEIRNLDALALLAYLKTFTIDNYPTREKIKAHFRMGDQRLNKAFKFLRENGYITYIQGNEANGNFKKVRLIINV